MMHVMCLLMLWIIQAEPATCSSNKPYKMLIRPPGTKGFQQRVCVVHIIIIAVSLADLHTKFSGARPSPTGPNSFVFTYIFTEKCPQQRSMPPPPHPMGPSPSCGKSWIRPWDYSTHSTCFQFGQIHCPLPNCKRLDIVYWTQTLTSFRLTFILYCQAGLVVFPEAEGLTR